MSPRAAMRPLRRAAARAHAGSLASVRDDGRCSASARRSACRRRATRAGAYTQSARLAAQTLRWTRRAPICAVRSRPRCRRRCWSSAAGPRRCAIVNGYPPLAAGRIRLGDGQRHRDHEPRTRSPEASRCADAPISRRSRTADQQPLGAAQYGAFRRRPVPQDHIRGRRRSCILLVATGERRRARPRYPRMHHRGGARQRARRSSSTISARRRPRASCTTSRPRSRSRRAPQLEHYRVFAAERMRDALRRRSTSAWPRQLAARQFTHRAGRRPRARDISKRTGRAGRDSLDSLALLAGQRGNDTSTASIPRPTPRPRRRARQTARAHRRRREPRGIQQQGDRQRRRRRRRSQQSQPRPAPPRRRDRYAAATGDPRRRGQVRARRDHRPARPGYAVLSAVARHRPRDRAEPAGMRVPRRRAAPACRRHRRGTRSKTR